MATTLTLPADVRLMNVVASLIYGLVVLALLAAALAALSRAQAFAFRSVQVDGDLQRHTLADLRAHALPKLRGDFFTLDLKRAQQAFESVPWVRRASVERVFPDRLLVHVEEHVPAALWDASSSAERLLNTHGELFDANLGEVEEASLPVFNGPPDRAAQMLAMHRRLNEVFKTLERRVDTLELSGRGSWQLQFDDGARLDLGRGSHEEVLERSARFARTLPQLLARYERPLVSADLRHRDGYALKLKGVVTLLDLPPAGAAAPTAPPPPRPSPPRTPQR
jgi:cell division protein FtsQ